MDINRIIEFAVEEAKKSDYKMRVGCVIFDKNKIIAKGHNYKQKSVRSITKKFQKWEFSVHAEVDTIINSRRDLKGKSLLVIRINNDGKLMLSKPCKYCRGYIEHVGIKRTFYSSKEGEIVELQAR